MKRVRRRTRDWTMVVGLIIAVLALVSAVLAPWLAPSNPYEQTDVLATRFLPPFSTGPDGVTHWFGTDRFGRDVLSRLLYGAQISLTVGLLSVAISTLLGLGVGISAAVFGGRLDRILMAVTDAALALPRLVLLLALVAIFNPSLWLVVVVLGCTGWMPVARLSRAEIRSMLSRPFVVAARGYGLSTWRLITRHLLPNTLTPVLVAGALAVGNAITLESGLAFLGLGVPPPAPSWGSMIAGGRDALVFAPWIAVFPGVAIAMMVLACNLIGDGLRDWLDPQSR
jgi:peptide/nickel transport system permease protein